MDDNQQQNYTEVSAKIKAILTVYKNNSKNDYVTSDVDKILHIHKLPLSIADRIVINDFDLESKLLRYRSPLQDNFVGINRVASFFESLSENGGYLSLNHIGFCYPERDIEMEKNLITNFCRVNNLNLFFEHVEGFDPWFFVGSKNDTSSPMIEFLPTSIIPADWASTKDYWLPQIQIDIDTSHSEEKIKEIHSKVFDEEPKLQQLFVSNGTVVVYRLRLGVLDGVNINLDIGTSARKTDWYRENVLVKVNL